MRLRELAISLGGRIPFSLPSASPEIFSLSYFTPLQAVTTNILRTLYSAKGTWQWQKRRPPQTPRAASPSLSLLGFQRVFPSAPPASLAIAHNSPFRQQDPEASPLTPRNLIPPHLILVSQGDLRLRLVALHLRREKSAQEPLCHPGALHWAHQPPTPVQRRAATGPRGRQSSSKGCK